MNPLHLLYIIPLSVCFGYFIAAVMMMSQRCETKENSEEVTKRESTDL